MDRNLTPSKSSITLSDSEFASGKRLARLPVKGAKSNPYGDAGHAQNSHGTAAAMAAEAERQFVRDRPDVVARSEKMGK
jgi:hypothetical protein